MMATIKAYTDLEQSKKLAEILPLESADMWWLYVTSQGKHIAMMYEEPDPHYIARMESYGIKDAAIRCWSLASLLGVLPEIQGGKPVIALDDNYISYPHMSDLHTKADNIVDACVAMIERLHELNLL